MSAAVFIRPRSALILPERVVIFFFLLCGSLGSRFHVFSPPQFSSVRLGFAILLGSMLLLSASGFGRLFLPLEMLCFGSFFQELVQSWYASSTIPAVSKLSDLLFSSLLFLSVFLAATYGLGASSALRGALFSGSPSACARYRQKLSAAALCSLISLTGIFYFT